MDFLQGRCDSAPLIILDQEKEDPLVRGTQTIKTGGLPIVILGLNAHS